MKLIWDTITLILMCLFHRYSWRTPCIPFSLTVPFLLKDSKSQMPIVTLRTKTVLEQNFLTAKEPRTHGSSVRDFTLKTVPLRCSCFHFSTRTGPRIEGNSDLWTWRSWFLFNFDKHLLSGVTLRIFYRRSLEDFLLYLKMMRSITSCKYLKRTYILEKWLWLTMCSLPLKQLCSTLLRITHTKKKLPRHFLQQLAMERCFCSWTGEANCNSNEHQ